MSDLQRLIAAVESGTLAKPGIEHCLSAMPQKTWQTIKDAYNGSLDAAKALHEALLPGWQYHLSEGVASVEGTAWQLYAQSTTTARAWLLAILRAVEAKGGAE